MDLCYRVFSRETKSRVQCGSHSVPAWSERNHDPPSFPLRSSKSSTALETNSKYFSFPMPDSLFHLKVPIPASFSHAVLDVRQDTTPPLRLGFPLGLAHGCNLFFGASFSKTQCLRPQAMLLGATSSSTRYSSRPWYLLSPTLFPPWQRNGADSSTCPQLSIILYGR